MEFESPTTTDEVNCVAVSFLPLVSDSQQPYISQLLSFTLNHFHKISKALTGADRKDLMRKLPKFIYDEEKALERTRKILTDKIAQLNSAIDDVSSQLRADDEPNGVAVTPDELEAST